MTQRPISLTSSLADFDLSQLPEDLRDITHPDFKQNLQAFLAKDYDKAGLFSVINITDDTLSISEDTSAKQQAETALTALNNGNYATGKPLLEALLLNYPNNTLPLYNLGLVYSDEGNFERAIECLSAATRINNKHAHAWTALAIAYLRAGNLEKAVDIANIAFDVDDEDPYVLRTTGTLMAQTGNIKDALRILKKATQVNPKDSITLYSLAECLVTEGADGWKAQAERLYKQIIELAPGSPQAEKAKDRLREFAFETFQKKTELRPEAVKFCLEALQKIHDLSDKEIAGIAIEAATLGQSGLSIDNPEKQYTLNTLPGKYTGLIVVCILHVAVQHLSPGTDSGFSIHSEYDEAVRLFSESPI